MKPKSNLRLRKIGRQYMIVNTRQENVDLSDVFTLNETAAGLWQQMIQGTTVPEELADWLCEIYEVDRETALQDVKKQLAQWKVYRLID